MQRPETARVFDRAPMLFRSRRNFAAICEKTVAVRAVDAVDAFNEVQILEPAPVEDQIIRALSLWNAIHREANRLINSQEKVEQEERNDATINDRRCQDREDAGIQNIPSQRRFEPPVLSQNRLFELDLAPGPAKLKRPLDFLPGGFQWLCFKSSAK